MGLDLTTADVDALEERTEGWISGVQLAALSLRGLPERGEVTDFIEAFTGSNRFVIDYLADEVLLVNLRRTQPWCWVPSSSRMGSVRAWAERG